MAYFSWSDRMSVGNRFIDADHRNIIDIVNRLHDAMQERKGGEVLDQVLFDLVVYTKGHFKREEQHMHGIGFSGLEAHKREHDLLLQRVAEFRHDLKQGSETQTIQVAEFLRTWLMEHIMESDMALGAAIRKSE